MATDTPKDRQQPQASQQHDEVSLKDHDLEPKKDQSAKIRGGALPPDDVRLNALPPDE